MEIYGIEYMPFEDCICQVWDRTKKNKDFCVNYLFEF
jgi:hypothetical protein